jgi:hypothetical protein
MIAFNGDFWLDEKLEEFLGGLSRKFYAKLLRVAAECNVDPSVVVNEGVELYRKRFRLMNGPLSQKLNDPALLEQYSHIQQLMGKMGAGELTTEARRQRAIAGAKSRAKKLQEQKVATKKSAS